MFGQRSDELLARASGAVLEIRAGAGENLARYRDVERVVAAEADPAVRASYGKLLCLSTFMAPDAGRPGKTL